MKKSVLLFLISAFGLFFIFFILLVSASLEINSSTYSGSFTQGTSSGNITNSSYSGDSASFYQQPVGYLNDLLFSGIHGFSFQIASTSGALPSLSIIKPSNGTYIDGLNLPLNFTALNALSVWYNLDSGSNTTVTSNTTFNTTSGLHVLYLFANGIYGNSSSNVSFTVNTDKFIAHYNNYSGSTKGSSTDFNASSYEELQNLSGIVLENTNYGKIAFNTSINVTNDLTYTDNDLNLDINISNNSIVVNSTALPNFNTSATLSLYGLTFANPRILKDGGLCPSTICTRESYVVNATYINDTISYSRGVLVFNVTQFSNYSTEETPVANGTTITTTVTTSSGGGGGSRSTGGVVYTKKEVSVSEESVKVQLKSGEITTKKITIKNIGTRNLVINIENLNLANFLIIKEPIFNLAPGESKELTIDIVARENILPDLYLGKLIIKFGGTDEEVLMVVEVVSEGILLDIRIEIPVEYKQILPGEEILVEMRLFNLGGSDERKDVIIEYVIRDYGNNEIVKETESLAIETQATFIKRIKMPQDAILGKYALYVRAIYNDKIASSSDNFEIVASKVTNKEKIYIVIIIILAIILSLVIYFTRMHGGTKKGTKDGGKVDLKSIMKK